MDGGRRIFANDEGEKGSDILRFMGERLAQALDCPVHVTPERDRLIGGYDNIGGIESLYVDSLFQTEIAAYLPCNAVRAKPAEGVRRSIKGEAVPHE